MGKSTSQVVVLGGGIAGVEAVLALDDLAGDRATLTLVSDRPEFVMKPLVAEEPFSGIPADTYELDPLMKGVGGRLAIRRATEVRTDEKEIVVDDGSTIGYDALLVCIGARPVPAFKEATTLTATAPLPISELITQAVRHPSKTLSILVPPGESWPLPAYEFALQTQQRAVRLGLDDLQVELVTPEDRALAIFGPRASAAVEELLRARGIALRTQTRVEELADGQLACHPGKGVLASGAAIAMPQLLGPSLKGLPSDFGGFIPTDLHGQVKDTPGVWAAGDGTAFPVKQGGLATEQADAAATSIAASLGADVIPEPFSPVLYGQLLTGDESLSMNKDLRGGDGEGDVTPDRLWWPPTKVVGRYLPDFLEYEARD